MEPLHRDSELIAEVEAVRARLVALDAGADTSFRDRVASELDVLLADLRASRRDLERFDVAHPLRESALR